MENNRQEQVDEARGATFDQSVEELTQLESELEKKPNNERIKALIQEVTGLLNKLLAELDEEPTPTAGNTQKIGNQSLGAANAVLQMEQADQKPDNRYYTNSEGLVSGTPEDAIANEPDNWRNTAAS